MSVGADDDSAAALRSPGPILPAVSAGLIAAFVGFASSFPVVLQGLAGVGASPAEASSGLMAMAVAMGFGGIVLSLSTRMPVSIVWTTPGAALLATAAMPEGGFAEAVGAFVVTALLIVLAGLWRPLGRLIAAVPASIASAMLAGILLALTLAPFRALAEEPLFVGIVIVVWLAMQRIARLYAVPVAALVAILLVAWQADDLGALLVAPVPTFVAPQWSVAGLLGLAVPLFIVTMASQNIPGFAVLRTFGYAPPARAVFAVTGLLSAVAAPFGGAAVNLAAITAAICAGPDAGPDRSRRYIAATTAGVATILFGLGAGLITAFSAVDPLLIQTVAGLALIGAFIGALQGALAETDDRLGAGVTFLVTASGVTLAGISAPFWGLLAGALTLLVTHPGAFRPAGHEPVTKTPDNIPIADNGTKPNR